MTRTMQRQLAVMDRAADERPAPRGGHVEPVRPLDREHVPADAEELERDAGERERWNRPDDRGRGRHRPVEGGSSPPRGDQPDGAPDQERDQGRDSDERQRERERAADRAAEAGHDQAEMRQEAAVAGPERSLRRRRDQSALPGEPRQREGDGDREPERGEVDRQPPADVARDVRRGGEQRREGGRRRAQLRQAKPWCADSQPSDRRVVTEPRIGELLDPVHRQHEAGRGDDDRERRERERPPRPGQERLTRLRRREQRAPRRPVRVAEREAAARERREEVECRERDRHLDRDEEEARCNATRHVRDELAQGDPESALAGDDRSGDEVAAAEGERQRTQDARLGRPRPQPDHRHRHDRGVLAARDDAGDHDRERNRRDHEEDADQRAQQRVDVAADRAGGDPNGHCEAECEHGCAEHDLEGQRRRVQHLREHIVALQCRSERMRPARAGVARREHGVDGAVARRDERPDDRGQRRRAGGERSRRGHRRSRTEGRDDAASTRASHDFTF